MPEVEPETVRVDAFAKLTLSLRITGTRADGYHELDATMVSISEPHDTLIINRAERTSLTVTGRVATTHLHHCQTDPTSLTPPNRRVTHQPDHPANPSAVRGAASLGVRPPPEGDHTPFLRCPIIGRCSPGSRSYLLGPGGPAGAPPGPRLRSGTPRQLRRNGPPRVPDPQHQQVSTLSGGTPALQVDASDASARRGGCGGRWGFKTSLVGG